MNGELIVKERRRMGLNRPVREVTRTTKPHPSRGGSNGYDIHFRQDQIEKYQNQENTIASGRSCRRWIQRLEPYAKSGNKQHESIVGKHCWRTSISHVSLSCHLP